MKVQRYSSIFSIANGSTVESSLNLRSEFDESIADKRYFQPVRESVKSIPSGSLSDSGLYDFMDGKDTGMEVPIGRVKGVDMAEVSNDIRNQQKKVAEKVKEAQEIEKLDEKINGFVLKKDSEVGQANSQK